ncbi:hypothetical protein [Ensifer canadensis]|uniref:hypothetical protein n=1 Tax=Ensifer canadensis TaxID=555315 RepID=UPI0035E3C036
MSLRAGWIWKVSAACKAWSRERGRFSSVASSLSSRSWQGMGTVDAHGTVLVLVAIMIALLSVAVFASLRGTESRTTH